MVKFFILELSSALMSLQKYRIVLRSLVPEAISLTTEGHVRLSDFDFAKVLPDDLRTFTMCGSPEYLAPEVVRGLGCGLAADWWALGVLMFEMLTGLSPFAADTAYRVYQNIEQGRLVIPKDVNSTDAALIRQLLVEAEASRPGAGGEASLRRHSYFKCVDWNAVERELLEPGIKPFAVANGGRIL